MTANQQRNALEKILSSSLSRVIDFLNFAETKNTAMLTFASAWMVLIINLVAGDRALLDGMKTALPVALALFGAAALVAIWSFLPKRSLRISTAIPTAWGQPDGHERAKGRAE